VVRNEVPIAFEPIRVALGVVVDLGGSGVKGSKRLARRVRHFVFFRRDGM
jgi:hypothetical protein